MAYKSGYSHLSVLIEGQKLTDQSGNLTDLLTYKSTDLLANLIRISMILPRTARDYLRLQLRSSIQTDRASTAIPPYPRAH